MNIFKTLLQIMKVPLELGLNVSFLDFNGPNLVWLNSLYGRQNPIKLSEYA
jgi:hypothetical protein